VLAARIEEETVGRAWLAVAERILGEGRAFTYDGRAIRELELVTLSVASPRSDDPTVIALGDPERLAWMHANFAELDPVAELGQARSYASRLYDYAGSGRDQVRWVIERLRADATSRSATITTFEPLLDTTYIPCVSLLDFWISDQRLHTIAYAHSIDFGTKGYANLVELAHLMERVGAGVACEVGRLEVVVKSAHIYDTDAPRMREVLAAAASSVRSDGRRADGVEATVDVHDLARDPAR